MCLGYNYIREYGGEKVAEEFTNIPKLEVLDLGNFIAPSLSSSI